MTLLDFSPVVIVSLLSGFIGTVVMTLSQIIEMKIRNRKASFTPAIAVSNVFKIDFEHMTEDNKVRFNNAVHWVYGSLLGLLMLIFYFIKVDNLIYVIIIFFIIIFLQGLIILPVLKVTSPPWKWKMSDILIDALHHFVYAVGTVFTYIFVVSSLI